ncbi:MAG TPA: hypothetical protein VMV89_07490 [Candidatus Paceibacterota bacterium]|nr:hypothetical protein [Candidatus Paceibacterota bacterium]
MTDNFGLVPPGNFPTLGQRHIKLCFAMRQIKKEANARKIFGLTLKVSPTTAAALGERPFVTDFAPQTATLSLPNEK